MVAVATPETVGLEKVVSEEKESEDTEKKDLKNESEGEQSEKQQELDWKTDEDLRRFMGNRSIEAAIKIEKKMIDRKLKRVGADSCVILRKKWR
ncbi:hypothetical protein LguiA_000064 [Lonicera macranthoides]